MIKESKIDKDLDIEDFLPHAALYMIAINLTTT